MSRNGHNGALSGVGRGVSQAVEFAQMVEAAQDPKSPMEVRERMAEIELALEDLGWVRMGWETQGQLSRSGLRKLTIICRQLYLKHPLINHAVNIRTNYVWGQGISVVAKAAEINAVIQSWWDLKENKVELTGHRARMLKEKELAVAGNIFLALFSDPIRGTVRVRSIEVEEIEDIISNPDDRREPWYYHRRWQQPTAFDPEIGISMATEQVEAYHPDWLYRPKVKPAKLGGIPVRWDAPVYHMKVGGLDNMRFGVPTIFPAIDWARAVQKDLENYATVKASLARFSTLLTVKGSPATRAAAKAMLASTISSGTSSGEHNPPPVAGSAFIQADGAAKLEGFKSAGLQANPDEGRRLGLMVGAGADIPETMLWGDATLGNYATAKSLDRPTELSMTSRQQDWVDTFVDITGYVLDQSGLATKGQLRSKVQVDEYSGETQVLILAKKGGAPLDRRVDVAFPAILEHDVLDTVQAISTAATFGGYALSGLIDQRTLARLLLIALQVNNVDEVLDRTHPDEPNPPAVDPGAPAVPAPPPAPGGPPAPGPTPGAPPVQNTPDPEPASGDGSGTTEALRDLGERLDRAVERIGQQKVTSAEDVMTLVIGAAKEMKPDLGPLFQQIAEAFKAQHDGLVALAQRPIAVEVSLPPAIQPRRVVKETKFTADKSGKIVGKTEREVEE